MASEEQHGPGAHQGHSGRSHWNGVRLHSEQSRILRDNEPSGRRQNLMGEENTREGRKDLLLGARRDTRERNRASQSPRR